MAQDVFYINVERKEWWGYNTECNHVCDQIDYFIGTKMVVRLCRDCVIQRLKKHLEFIGEHLN